MTQIPMVDTDEQASRLLQEGRRLTEELVDQGDEGHIPERKGRLISIWLSFLARQLPPEGLLDVMLMALEVGYRLGLATEEE